jgi:hypothetical protein
MLEDQRDAVQKIRQRHNERVAEGLVGGVREWFEIATLLGYIDQLEQYAGDAHRDAIVNRDTADRLEKELQKAREGSYDQEAHGEAQS